MKTTLRETYISTNGIRLHAMEAGPSDGPLVVLLLGFPEFWYGWRKQIDPLAEAGYRIVALDQRGYNLSDKPRGVAAYGLDPLADDVLGVIDALGRDKCAIVGHDWGAAVAWWLGIRDPQRINHLAILNVPHPIVMRAQLRTNFAQLRKSWYMFFFQIPWLPETLVGLRRFQVAAESLVKTSRPGTFTQADLDEYRRAWSQPGAMTAMINWYRAIVRVPTRRVPSIRVTVPTLILWGVKDRFLGRELAPPSLELCDNGRLVFLDDASHWVQHEEPGQVNELLLSFLGDKAGP